MKRIILLNVIGVLLLKASTIEYTISFSMKDFNFTKQNGYDFIEVKDQGYILTPGEPMLPVKYLHFSLPYGAKVEKVYVTYEEKERIEGEYFIYPAQPPIPISFKVKKEFIEPSPEIYNSAFPFPSNSLEYVHTGNMRTYTIASVKVYPFEYIPKERKLFLRKKISFVIEYTVRPETKTRRGFYTTDTLFKDMVKMMVVNSYDVDKNTPNLNLQEPEYDHVIITTPSFSSGFEKLRDWNTKKGIKDTIVYVNDIYSEYSGDDNQEKIRNFIKDAVDNWGVAWVLLGGDPTFVPTRTAFAMESGAGYYPDEDSLKCDLYYSDLDGTWDANDNGIYGEVADNVDMYPDVFVGRSPARSASEAQKFSEKVIAYETQAPLEDFELTMLFMAYHLDEITHAEYLKDEIDNYYVPSSFDPITKLYEDNGNWGRSKALAELNKGYNIINHADHANQYELGVGAYNYNESLSRNDLSGLTNSPRYSIFYSIGCWAAAIDYDCVGEHFVNASNGGGIAFIGNSRYGLYAKGHPELYSGQFDKEFFKKLFTDEITTLGKTHAQAKATYVSYAGGENAYRWIEYSLNLLGEPYVEIWTEEASQFELSFSSPISTGSQSFEVTVKDAESQNPVQGALVCVWKKDEVYEKKTTGTDGKVNFTINPQTAGDMFVTAVKKGYIPKEDTCKVEEQGLNAEFVASPTEGCAPLTVSFTDNSTGGPTSWLWDFGDGSTSTDQNPTHTYETPGNYTVSLTISNGVDSDTETKENYISVGAVPEASFSASPRSGPPPLQVQFTDNSTGNPTSWLWDFGDGSTSTDQNPTHTYNEEGSYTVSLTVSNACGEDTKVVENYIVVGGSLVADFTATPVEGCSPLEVSFTDNSTGGPTSWLWDFGDGSTSTEQNPTHIYENGGTYTVTLTVQRDGLESTVKKDNYINVYQSPQADFTADKTKSYEPLFGHLTVQFTDNSTGNPTSWLWDFGDGSTSTEQNPVHTYEKKGSYTVSLRVEEEHGCFDEETKEDFIVISDTPIAFALFSFMKEKPLVVYDIPKISQVRIELYSVSGRHIRTIEKGIKNPGRYYIDLCSLGLSKGVYFVRLSSPAFTDVKKVVVY